MAHITLDGEPLHTVGELPAVGAPAPDFQLTRTDLSELRRDDLAGRILVLNIFPSIDTPVCAESVRRFNAEASSHAGVVVLCVAADLPFAMARFCGAEGLESVIPVSCFRNPAFGDSYGVRISDGPLAGLLSRAVVVIDADGRVAYREQVGEIADAPDVQGALAVIKTLRAPAS